MVIKLSNYWNDPKSRTHLLVGTAITLFFILIALLVSLSGVRMGFFRPLIIPVTVVIVIAIIVWEHAPKGKVKLLARAKKAEVTRSDFSKLRKVREHFRTYKVRELMNEIVEAIDKIDENCRAMGSTPTIVLNRYAVYKRIHTFALRLDPLLHDELDYEIESRRTDEQIKMLQKDTSPDPKGARARALQDYIFQLEATNQLLQSITDMTHKLESVTAQVKTQARCVATLNANQGSRAMTVQAQRGLTASVSELGDLLAAMDQTYAESTLV